MDVNYNTARVEIFGAHNTTGCVYFFKKFLKQLVFLNKKLGREFAGTKNRGAFDLLSLFQR